MPAMGAFPHLAPVSDVAAADGPPGPPRVRRQGRAVPHRPGGPDPALARGLQEPQGAGQVGVGGRGGGVRAHRRGRSGRVAADRGEGHAPHGLRRPRVPPRRAGRRRVRLRPVRAVVPHRRPRRPHQGPVQRGRRDQRGALRRHPQPVQDARGAARPGGQPSGVRGGVRRPLHADLLGPQRRLHRSLRRPGAPPPCRGASGSSSTSSRRRGTSGVSRPRSATTPASRC